MWNRKRGNFLSVSEEVTFFNQRAEIAILSTESIHEHLLESVSLCIEGNFAPVG